MIQNAEFSGYYFYMDKNIWTDFQICISVPLNPELIANYDKIIKTYQKENIFEKIETV